MDLLEHEGKSFLAGYGIDVPDGAVAVDAEQAVAAARTLGYPLVVKAQVRVGGRGKAGGIRVVADEPELRAAAHAILGLDIRGHTVRRLWLEPAADIAAECYASFTFDRAARLHLGMVSARGGVEIEQVAAESPEAVARLHVDPLDGLTPEAASGLVASADIPEGGRDGVASLLVALYRAYVDGDAELVEVNPLAILGDGSVRVLDAKVVLDDNASWRHPEWEEWRQGDDLDPRDRAARERGLTYVGLDGSVGIIGNGAGLVMSTLDVVAQAGGSAANFLDVGGGASADVMAAALEVVNDDPSVRAILVNIFGGITRGEEVANGIVAAMGRVELRSPIVVRLDGTNAEAGRAILAANPSDLLLSEPTMLDAARTAVRLASERPA